MPTAAIVLSRQRLSGYALLDLIQATSSQHHRQRQLPFKGDRHSSAESREWARHARAKPGEPAELWYRGSVGPSARVHGHGGTSGRPRRRVATRLSIVSRVRKKYDTALYEKRRKNGRPRHRTLDAVRPFGVELGDLRYECARSEFSTVTCLILHMDTA
jgi:hypothetical protein